MSQIAANLWEVLQAVVGEAGLSLFDVEAPKSNHGVFRIYIAKDSSGKAAVAIEDCIRVSKRISQREDFEQLFPGSTLEVSSPGINRKLRRPEHFQGAVGERVKLNSLQSGAVVGTLQSFDGTNLSIETGADQVSVLPLAEVRDARVEFLFT